jgi:hypothetical protein
LGSALRRAILPSGRVVCVQLARRRMFHGISLNGSSGQACFG